jgi:hypothetical protein
MIVDPDSYGSALIWSAETRSGSMKAKITYENRKKWKKVLDYLC